MNNLRDICDYVVTRTNIIENYISTENMLPNKGGVCDTLKVPSGGIGTKYQVGDILISNIRPYFKKIWQADCEGACSTDVLCLRANENVDSRFLYYLLTQQSFFDFVMSGTKGCKMPRGDKQQIMQWSIHLPSLVDQKKIAGVLSVLDAKIQVNRSINDNLEQQAQALYKSWFVDFEPFNEDEFVETEVGMVPRGWRIGNLLDVAELYDSKRKPLSGMQRSTMKKIYPYYGATSIMDYVDNYIFDGTYLLMGEDGSVITDEGYPFLQYVSGKFWPNNHAHVMQGKNGFTTEMLHCFLLKKNISEIVTGAVQAKVSQGNMKKISLAIAPNEILSAFAQVLDGIYAKIRAIYSENHQLETMRDTLLPKLMSGELKIYEIDC